MPKRYIKEHKGAGAYIFQRRHKGEFNNKDIGKDSIPPKDRCPDFDELWNRTFDEVMQYWDWEEVNDINEFT